ncbi:MAG: hypothetical protein V2A79_02965, partial [Planctomycetota bacterium]
RRGDVPEMVRERGPYRTTTRQTFHRAPCTPSRSDYNPTHKRSSEFKVPSQESILGTSNQEL